MDSQIILNTINIVVNIVKLSCVKSFPKVRKFEDIISIIPHKKTAKNIHQFAYSYVKIVKIGHRNIMTLHIIVFVFIVK